MRDGETVPTDQQRGVDRLIDLAEQALAAGDRDRALSIATQARVLSPGDARIQRIFLTEVVVRRSRPMMLIMLGTAVVIAALAVAAFALAAVVGGLFGDRDQLYDSYVHELKKGKTCEQRKQQGGGGTGWLGCQAGDDRLRLDGPWVVDLIKGTCKSML